MIHAFSEPEGASALHTSTQHCTRTCPWWRDLGGSRASSPPHTSSLAVQSKSDFKSGTKGTHMHVKGCRVQQHTWRQKQEAHLGALVTITPLM